MSYTTYIYLISGQQDEIKKKKLEWYKKTMHFFVFIESYHFKLAGICFTENTLNWRQTAMDSLIFSFSSLK